LGGARRARADLRSAAIQQLEIPLHERHFDHNPLYHRVQAIALVLFSAEREEQPQALLGRPAR